MSTELKKRTRYRHSKACYHDTLKYQMQQESPTNIQEEKKNRSPKMEQESAPSLDVRRQQTSTFVFLKKNNDFKHEILYPAKLALNYRCLKLSLFWMCKDPENVPCVYSSELSENMLRQKKGVNKKELHLRSRIKQMEPRRVAKGNPRKTSIWQA